MRTCCCLLRHHSLRPSPLPCRCKRCCRPLRPRAARRPPHFPVICCASAYLQRPSLPGEPCISACLCTRILTSFPQTISGDTKCPAALCATACSDSASSAGFSVFESRDAVVVGIAAAAQHVSASVSWVFCNGDRMRPRAQGSQSDKSTCSLLLSAIEALLPSTDGAPHCLVSSAADNCARRSILLPEDPAYTYHDPPAAGDVIYH